MRRTTSSLTTVSIATLAALASGDAQAAIDGPDAFGYRLVDHNDGAPFDYVDITATGMMVATGDDQLAPAFALGAPFEFYGVVVNDVRVSTNGFITSTAGTDSDFSNDCPIPFAAGGGGFRIAALHDDFISDVYYQYLDEVAAAAAGFPGETAGISVFQWVGEHFPAGGADPVEFEAILFHDDFTILTMVAVDAENGLSSTLGIQNENASLGLNYVCNTGGSVIPGLTAVQYILGPAPDSNCCSPSPTATPGCTNPTCQDAVCGFDEFCCTMEWDAVCAGEAATACGVLCGMPPAVSINEIRIDQTGTDNDEYFELAGPPGTLLTDVQYLVVGDTPTGTVEAAVDLSGRAIPPSGFLVVAEGTFTLGGSNVTTSLNFENVDTVTHMLVGGFTGTVNQNLDANADGVFDVTPWSAVLDTVAVVHPPSTDLPYGPPLNCAAGPLCQEVDDGIDGAFQLYRCPDGDGVWQIGNDDIATMPATDSPRNPNVCGACSNGVVDPGEDCDGGGETAMCNVNCTFASCGDGIVNGTAGEHCDDIGESSVCNANCTNAVCGDSIINATANETCDDGGESAACDDDCTAALCGDGVTNATAGEACDTTVESAACNANCTLPACGDGVVNMAAGEACDDGGESATCNADCTLATCGDGIINMAAGEECDDNGESATCDDDCTAAMCGDMTVNTTAGETCDDGGRSPLCNVDCTAATCGDGMVNMAAGEECDGDGMGMPGETDTCDDDCTNAMCGDAVINVTAGEVCDDGGESATCDDDCTDVMCGDSVVNATAGEDCDDGGESETCNDDCTTATCGDGLANTTAGEECDDGGESKGCDDDCTIATCGDGLINATAGEECDDGNTDDGDGCAADCTDEMTGTTGGSDTDADSSGGGSGVDSTGGGPGPVTTPADDGSTSRGETDTETGGSVPGVGDDGCSCSTSGDRNGSNALWSMLAVFGLGALRRRRRA
ncbi:MYXO-CTERM sorting domain-containing protein [Paraliomyxa miuraensis]|uniref:MYXO-CTERM sorting domain-containing protein n=1 Tax=Paraliomyxa miuraensis TaxID=376150 RepID=UPI00224E8DA0|nr:MYXO-CTERM sorting domain-containing protein [Paraliomyxa miuraensis]MCX4246072.1 MYXO-CTERM sorting domain-containing protein [Paraliomyxa miuraensis]